MEKKKSSKRQVKHVDATFSPSSNESFKIMRFDESKDSDKYASDNEQNQGNPPRFKPRSSKEDLKWSTPDGQPFFGKNPHNITDLAAKQTFLSPERNIHHQIEKKIADSKVG